MSLKALCCCSDSSNFVNPEDYEYSHLENQECRANAISAVVGAALGTLVLAGLVVGFYGAFGQFGAVGTVGFCTSVSIGFGITAVVAPLPFILRCISNCKNEDSNNQKLEETQNSYPSPAQAAFDFVKSKHTCVDIKRKLCALDDVFQPLNPTISTLSHFCVTYLNQLRNAVCNKPSPYFTDEAQDASTQYLQLSFVISTLCLDELPEFVIQLEQQGAVTRGYGEVLNRTDSYQRMAYRECANAYHYLRGKITQEFTMSMSEKDKDTYHKSFYKEGTVQSKWRALYNEFCEHALTCVGQEELLINQTLYLKDESYENYLYQGS